MTSLACNSIMELAHKMVLTSKFCTSGGVGVGGEEDNVGEVRVEREKDGALGMGGVG